MAREFVPVLNWGTVFNTTPSILEERLFALTTDIDRCVSNLYSERKGNDSRRPEINVELKAVLSLDNCIREIALTKSFAERMKLSLRELPESIRPDAELLMLQVESLYSGVPFSLMTRCWFDHAIQPCGHDVVTIESVEKDLRMSASGLRLSDDWPDAFPNAMLPTISTLTDCSIWTRVDYRPSQAHRALRALLHVNRVGREQSRQLRRVVTSRQDGRLCW